MAFNRVPSPGVCFSGIHNSNTPTLTTNVAQPILKPVTMPIPWANTVHGLTPAPAAINAASPIPNITNPLQRINNVFSLGRKLSGCSELQETEGTALTDNNFIMNWRSNRCCYREYSALLEEAELITVEVSNIG